MGSFLRDHATLIVVVGAGVALGTTATLVLHRASTKVHRELSLLAYRLEQLRKEVEELKTVVEGVPKKRSSGRSTTDHYFSDDDDDIFEEAIDGRDPEAFNFSSPDEYLSLTSEDGISPLSLENLTEQVDRLLAGNDHDKERALSLLRPFENQYETEVEYLWRLSKAMFQTSQTKDDERKKLLIYKAYNTVTNAMKMDGNNANVHKWYAITLGSLGDYEGTQIKIKNGYTFREHILKAIALDPTDPSSHHLLGRWCYSVYMLSWLERQAATALYGAPPTSTADEALVHFIKAEKLNPGKWKDNMLYIAKCQIQKRDYYAAASWLEKAEHVPINGKEDREAQTEIDDLLYTYGNYRT